LWVEGGAPKGDDAYLPRIPAPEVPKPVRATPGIALRGDKTLTRGITATGIAPREMPPGASIQIMARLPDGSVRNLLWLRNHRTEWKQSFYFRDPLTLPKGTQIAVRPSAAAVILTGKPGL